MTASKNASHHTLHSDLERMDAHKIKPHEYDELPDLTDDDLTRGSFKRAGLPLVEELRRRIDAALADTRYRHYASLSDLNQYMDELRADRPDSRCLQDFARNVERVIAAFRSLKPDADDNEVVYLLKNYPLSDFGQKTAFELVEAGRTDDVVSYLESFRAGFVG